jgi:hypothetical protein
MGAFSGRHPVAALEIGLTMPAADRDALAAFMARAQGEPAR